LFERTLAIAPNAKLEKLEYTDPLDYSRDSQVDMTVSAEDYASGQGDVRVFRLPLMARPLGSWVLPDLNYDISAKERKFGLRLRASRRVILEEELKLPSGWKVVQAPDKKKIESPSTDMTFEVTPGDGVLKYRFELIIKHNIIPAEDYVEYKKAIDMMNELADERVICSVG
jgi:hypothetical protein